ncbi:nucleolar protein 12 [Neocloeon triangulifer]|uniref:nucleolar protein 12 n=1 Tax=Neocloeon triangulifer TaxID=2078957 RepID=UPI00286EF350|nr:nucleolar protein 12 [Neocloeon triangulifer]
MKNKGQGKVFRPKKAINKKNKVELVFDHEKRRDFLSGFHKRKMARKKRAQEELEAEMKAEKKRIKDEAKNLHNTMVVSYRPIPEVEELLGKEETYDLEQHSVSIKELSTASMAEDNFWIGENRTKYEEDDGQGEGSSEKPRNKDIKSGKDIKKAVKKMATKQMQKSKAFQKKGKLEQTKQKKKASVVRKLKARKNLQAKQRGNRHGGRSK